jgi:hypothetical protein
LYHSVAIDDEKRTLEEHCRIKILKDEGLEQANIEIPFVKGMSEITDLRARTVQKDGSTTPFEGIVFEKTIIRKGKLRYLAKVFTLPDARVGSILEYRYSIKRKEIPGAVWRLQSPLYTLHSHFSFRPSKLGERYQWVVLSTRLKRQPKLNADQSVELDLDDVPPFRSEEYTFPDYELMPRVRFFYLPYLHNVENYWAEMLTAQAEATESFLGKPKALAEAVNSIVRPADSDDQKLRQIYARVQSLRNLSHENGLTAEKAKAEALKENKSVQDVWKRGYGGGRDIDMLFVALARAAGFDSSFVLYVGRDRGFFHRDVPEFSQFSGFVAMVRLTKPDGATEDIFLDPAVPGLRYGMLDWDSTGVAAVRLTRQGGEFMTIANRREWGGTVQRKGTLDLDDSGKLSGTVLVSFGGQDALFRRKQSVQKELDDDQRREYLEEAIKEWVESGSHVKLLKMSGWHDGEESLTGEFSVEIPNFAAVTAQHLVAPATIFRTHHMLRDAAQQSTRLFPFYFPYAWHEDDDITIRLPAGAVVEQLPAPAGKEMTLARYQSSCDKHDGTLQMKRLLALDGIIYPNIEVFRGFLDNVRTSDENLVLVRRKTEGGPGR